MSGIKMIDSSGKEIKQTAGTDSKAEAAFEFELPAEFKMSAEVLSPKTYACAIRILSLYVHIYGPLILGINKGFAN